MTETLRNLHNSFKKTMPIFDIEFESLPSIDIDWRLFIMDFHPYKISKCGFRHHYEDDYNSDWDFLEIEKTILETALENISKKAVVKVVNSFPYNIHAITISPNPDFHQEETYLHNVVSQVVNRCKVLKSYGVFERGDKNNFYHVHFLIHLQNDKNVIQNIKKYLNNQNKNKKNIIMKIDKINGPVHLLKTLRYFEKDTKKNFGYFENQDARNNFYALTNSQTPLLKWNPKINI